MRLAWIDDSRQECISVWDIECCPRWMLISTRLVPTAQAGMPRRFLMDALMA